MKETTLAEPTSTQKKMPSAKKKVVLKKLDAEAAKLLQGLSDKANKKTFGRRVRDTEIICRALTLLQPEHLAELQQNTMNEKDRLNIAFEMYQKANGKVTMGQFIDKLLSNEIAQPHNK